MSDNGHEPYAYNPFVSDMAARQMQANPLQQQQGHQQLNAYPMQQRPCTCHPDDSPNPCQHKYAASECAEAARQQWTEAELDILRARGKPLPAAINKIVAAPTPGLDSTDALLEAVREMTLQVTALRTLITALREHMGDKPSVVAFPGNALRHSR